MSQKIDKTFTEWDFHDIFFSSLIDIHKKIFGGGQEPALTPLVWSYYIAS